MHPVDPDQVTIHGRTIAELKSQWAADTRRQRQRAAVARWEAHAAMLPVDAWFTVPELAQLWWPGRHPIAVKRKNETRAHKRMQALASVGLLDLDIQPHPTRKQVAYHARRVLTWADRGRWMVGELA